MPCFSFVLSAPEEESHLCETEFLWLLCCFAFETGSPTAQTGLEPALEAWLALNPWSSCLHFSSALQMCADLETQLPLNWTTRNSLWLYFFQVSGSIVEVRSKGLVKLAYPTWRGPGSWLGQWGGERTDTRAEELSLLRVAPTTAAIGNLSVCVVHSIEGGVS